MFKTILALAFLFSGAAIADHHKGPMKEPTKEERTAMSAMHAKMSECLKTEKPMADCHKEMMDSCPMAKDGKCPMMAHGHGPGHHGPMKKDMKGKDKKTE